MGIGYGSKDIRGGLTTGGRLRMERMAALCTYGRIKPEKNGHPRIRRIRQNGRGSHAHERKTKRSDQTCCSSGLRSESTTPPPSTSRKARSFEEGARLPPRLFREIKEMGFDGGETIRICEKSQSRCACCAPL